jgi:hypothetical protein
MKKLFVLFVLAFATVSCSSNGKRYRVTDYAHACVKNEDKELGKTVTDVCLPIDTYVNDMRYHNLKPYDKIKMHTLDDAMRYEE